MSSKKQKPAPKPKPKPTNYYYGLAKGTKKGK
jgi:hypothetical protein